MYYSEFHTTGRPAVRFAAEQLQPGAARQEAAEDRVLFRRRCGIEPGRRGHLRVDGAAVGEDPATERGAGRGCAAAIARGESANLEFKSTFRWDLREKRFNRSLESVVMKTLAGYMNGQGGTLLIGVADDGSIVGLELDYSTLKKPDRDGFEQVLMTAVASKLGGDACRNVQAVFHSVEGNDVCRVIVTAGHRPVYVREGDTLKLYVRTGVSTRELNVQDAINYTEVRWKR